MSFVGEASTCSFCKAVLSFSLTRLDSISVFSGVFIVASVGLFYGEMLNLLKDRSRREGRATLDEEKLPMRQQEERIFKCCPS